MLGRQPFTSCNLSFKAFKGLALCAFLAGVALGNAGAVAAVADSEYTRRLQAALEPMQADYTRIASANSSDVEFRRFQERLKNLEEVIDQLLRSLQSTKSASLDNMLSGLGGPPVARGSAPSRSAPSTVLAADVFANYQDIFSEPLPKPSLSQQDLDTLVRYYNITIQTAEAYIAERGKGVSGADARAATEVPRLCLVLTFLNVTDEQWTAEHVNRLLSWLREPKNLTTLEDFALSIQRPLTAFHLHAARPDSTTQPAQLVASTYLRSAAERLVSSRDFRSAIACLRAGIRAAESASQYQEATALHTRTAELLSQMGHPQLAADQMKNILDNVSLPADRGRTAMLRLKYLYEAEKFEGLLQEVDGYEMDPHCARYLPQLMYLKWVTQRRTDMASQAGKTQDIFLQKFPDHPLGADMHFASAMTSLAASDYDAARRELELIESRYPTSTLIPRVRDLNRRLQQAAAESARP